MSRFAWTAGLLGLLALLAAGCERTEARRGAVFVLLDVSRTFYPNKAASLETAEEIVKELTPGDRFAFVRVGDCAFGRENVMVDVDLPVREDPALWSRRT